jgi:transposase InsO family protein
VSWTPKAISCARSSPRVRFSEPIFLSVDSSRCLVDGVSEELSKWHRRLGHLSFDLLSRLGGIGLVRGLPKLKYQNDLVCASCKQDKMVAASHPPLTSVMTEKPCELFHMDLIGPARVCSAGGKWYVLVIVDDYSFYAWVFFLADKGETSSFVWDLILRLKNERNEDVVRAISSDNGSAFKNSHFETFFRDLGLEHQFSYPYLACQNGVVQRKNHSCCEMAQTMLDEHRTPRRYWAEAVNTTCHVGNRIFLRAFLNKMCYELMHGRAPRVSHFRAFGCRCFILKKGRLDKFVSRSSDGIFLDYASHSLAFRVLNLDTDLVIETCEVTFDETKPCNLSIF